EAAREREVLSQLSHLHIIELLSFNMRENLILIMPLRKDNLKNFLFKEKDNITNEHQIRYGMQISDALRYISHKKLIHGDLKTSNILVNNIKHVEVGDFGKCENMGNRRRTVGTITHSAMELLDKTRFGNGYSCEKTDIWSFGVTIWEIFNLCQKNPYDDEIKAANKRRNLNEIILLDYLLKGQRLNPPQGMQPSLQSVMIDCQ
uniref:Protein kinase domain-containing protein n=1 Tax=Panagrolaimus sp. ES5 TaxID=591445 RepID=A0AC34F499_9BILA